MPWSVSCFLPPSLPILSTKAFCYDADLNNFLEIHDFIEVAGKEAMDWIYNAFNSAKRNDQPEKIQFQRRLFNYGDDQEELGKRLSRKLSIYTLIGVNSSFFFFFLVC